MGSYSSGGVWRTTKWDSTGYFSSTVYFLQPPPATVHPPSTSSSLHQLLFIQPPPATVQPALHGVLELTVAIRCHACILPAWIQYRNEKDDTQFNIFLDH